MEKISIKGVTLGIVVDYVGSLLSGIALFVIFAGNGLNNGMSGEQVDELVQSVTQADAFLFFGFILINLVLCTLPIDLRRCIFLTPNTQTRPFQYLWYWLYPDKGSQF